LKTMNSKVILYWKIGRFSISELVNKLINPSIHPSIHSSNHPSKSNFFPVLGFEFRALHLLGRSSTTWVTPPALFCLSYFSDRESCFCWDGLEPPSSYLCLLCSCNYRREPPHLTPKVTVLGQTLLKFSRKCSVNLLLLPLQSSQ
jgi:hypothetical protein